MEHVIWGTLSFILALVIVRLTLTLREKNTFIVDTLDSLKASNGQNLKDSYTIERYEAAEAVGNHLLRYFPQEDRFFTLVDKSNIDKDLVELARKYRQADHQYKADTLKAIGILISVKTTLAQKERDAEAENNTEE